MQVVVDKSSLIFKFDTDLKWSEVNKIMKIVEQEVEIKHKEKKFINFIRKTAKPVKNFKFNRVKIYEERIGIR